VNLFFNKLVNSEEYLCLDRHAILKIWTDVEAYSVE